MGGFGPGGLTRMVLRGSWRIAYECVRKNELHFTYHVFCMFICLLF